MNHTVRVRYKDEKGKRSFDETPNLGMDQYMNMNTVTRHGLHDIHKELEKARKVLEKWGWGGGRGLVTMTPEESREESERMIEAMGERQRRSEGKGEEES